MLLEYVFVEYEYFDVDVLIEKFLWKGNMGYVSCLIVYRILVEFVDVGFLRKMDFEGWVVYEYDYGYL